MSEAPNISDSAINQEVPPWRHKKLVGKPVRYFDETARVLAERESRLPERLYRQMPIEDLYLLWRDDEMPLQPFEGSQHSQVEENSLGNFWFTQPIALDSVEAYVITEPAQWRQDPEYVQESTMSFKSDKKRSQMGEWAAWRPGSIMSHVEEVHTGNRLRKDDLTVCVSERANNQIASEKAVLLNWGLTDDQLAEAYLRGDLGTKPQPRFDKSPGAISVLRSGVLSRLAKVYKREFGALPRSADDMRSEFDREQEFGRSKIADPRVVGKLSAFYSWALGLPVIPWGAMPGDVDDVADSPAHKVENERRFLEFYEKIRPKQS